MLHLITSDAAGHEGDGVVIASNRDGGVVLHVGTGWDEDYLAFSNSTRVIVTRENASAIMLALHNQGIDLPVPTVTS